MIDLAYRRQLHSEGYWEVPDNLDTTNFDFTWRPNPQEPPMIHQFGTQWQKTGGPRFIIPEHEGTKYQGSQRAIRLPDNESRNWRPLIAGITIDYSWHPDDTEPPYIYVFGNQWYSGAIMPTIQYRVKGAPTYKYIDDVRAILPQNKDNWKIPDDISDDFDYSWVPNPLERPWTYQFGTQWQKTGGPVYHVEGSHGVKYMTEVVATKLPDPDNRCWRPLVSNVEMDYSWHPDDTEEPYIYVFGNQWYDAITMPTIQYRVKGAVEKKYVELKAKLIPTSDNWDIPDNIEDDFDYSWTPSPYEPPLIYQFGTQWQKTGGPRYTVEGATIVKYTDIMKAKRKSNMRNWTIPEPIDNDKFDFSWHPDDTEPAFIYEFGTQWQKTGGPMYMTRGATLKKYCDAQQAIRLVNMRNWRTIETIDSDSFDFSWHPDETEEPYMYVFGNEYFPPEIMPTIMYRCRDSIGTKYLTEPIAPLKIDVVEYEDSIFDSVMKQHYTTKYIHYKKKGVIPDYKKIIPNIENNLYLHILNDNEAIVPMEAKTKMFDKLSDYPYTMYHRHGSNNTEPLDIIFISNGEEIAEENYKYLLHVTQDLPNRVIRVTNINGRVASQHTAAKLSNTSWYFLVNGKLKVNENFDFGWQPDVFKSSRHYIFTATNPVTGLEYGHMATVANNKKLTLNTVVKGLDFTMDSPHEIVSINSGIGMYNTSSWDTWRTSFRETIKLCHGNDDESKHRLNAWLTIANGSYGTDSINGATDAVEYYKQSEGQLDKLMLTYDWDWLKSYYSQKISR